MKAKNFMGAVAIAAASETIGYDLYTISGLFSSLGSGSAFFLSYMLIPLGFFIVSWAGLSQIKEKKVVKVSETAEFAEMKKTVSEMKSKVEALELVLLNMGYVFENPVTESGFRAVHNQYLAPKVKQS